MFATHCLGKNVDETLLPVVPSVPAKNTKYVWKYNVINSLQQQKKKKKKKKTKKKKLTKTVPNGEKE